MKKNILFIIITLALGFASCNHDGGGGAESEAKAGFDVAILDNGKLSFYNAADKVLTPYEKEQDSVVNVLFTDPDHLYYTVSKDGALSLKMLDISAEKLESVLCADWNLTTEEAVDFVTDVVSRISYDTYGNNIIIFAFDPEEGYACPFAYGIDSHKVRKMNDEEFFSIYYSDFNESRFYSENHRFYYAGPQGKVCLTDKIDFASLFSEENEYEDLEFGVTSMSPDGKNVLYSAAVYWGEGWGYYCVANIDGTSQIVLEDSDLYHGFPAWLADGSLVYVGDAPLPENDPEYDEDYNTTQPCIKLLDTQKNISTVALGRTFAVRPVTSQKKAKESQQPLEGCDVALFDNGKVTFYNSATKKFVPLVAEQDSVVNGTFDEDNSFYYSVAIGDELYLKGIYMSEYETAPVMFTAWDLKLDDCVSKTYGKTSDLSWVPIKSSVGINHNFNWDYYNFSDVRFYNTETRTKQNGWDEEDDETDAYDESFLQYELDLDKFITEDNNYYFRSAEGWACISDKINFKEYASDPEEYNDPEFVFYSIDPTQNYVIYAALIEWGDFGHGPLCLASVDGKIQMALKDTDAATLTKGWLSDGSLLYVDEGASCIKIVRPGQAAEEFSKATGFVVKNQ